MSLDNILRLLDDFKFNPRTLQIQFPEDFSSELSTMASSFFSIVHNKTEISLDEWASDAWKDDAIAMSFFFECDDDVRTEILAFITVFIHEYTHRIDFLISPFGLHYYGKTILEYWSLQKFVPIGLDDPRTVKQLRYLVDFGEVDIGISENLSELWDKYLKYQIHPLYAWGDVTELRIPAKYMKSGWSGQTTGAKDHFDTGILMEPITVLDHFHTFRVPDEDGLWYVRPLTIFETKAIVNSMLFILYLLDEEGPGECLRYYEQLYLSRRNSLHADYFFLLDLGARIYHKNDFHDLLKTGNFQGIRSNLLILSTICWYALQAPPHISRADIRNSNPILRLWVGFMFFSAIAKKRIDVSGKSTAEMLLHLDRSNMATYLAQPSIEEVMKKSRSYLIELSEFTKKVWNPRVRGHFEHVLQLIRPHILKRGSSYISFLGMPENGNPLLSCSSEEDWELICDDYDVPQDVLDWLVIRKDLLFSMLKLSEKKINQLDEHFRAFLFPYTCQCGGITSMWTSRFFQEIEVTCDYCKRSKKLHRSEFTTINFDV